MVYNATKILLELRKINRDFYEKLGSIFDGYAPKMQTEAALRKIKEEAFFCNGLADYFRKLESLANYEKICEEIKDDQARFFNFINGIKPESHDYKKIQEMLSEIKKTKKHYMPRLRDLLHELENETLA